MSKFIIALDQGTTSSRAVLFDDKGMCLAIKQKEFRQIFPQQAWVEHDPKEIWETQESVLNEILELPEVKQGKILSIGVTNQRETTVIWNRLTGEPIYNALVWQDMRTAPICEDLRAQGLVDYCKKNTGLVIDSYFSGTKIKWILDHVEGAREKAEKGELCFGTIDTWLLWNLTKGGAHATDYSNASRTLIYNIIDLAWDEKMLEALQIPKSILPEVKDSASYFGTYESSVGSIPICAMIGDQQSALFGQACFEKGMAKNTYGTGCFLLMNTGNKFIESESKLLSTKAYNIFDKKNFALEGSIFNAGTVVQWMRDEMNFINDASEVEELANNSTNEIQFIPAFTGLGAPYWNSDVRGQITGITRDTSKADIAMAALKSICYQTRDLLECLLNDTELKRNDFTIRVDGGMSKNNLMMQLLSDITQVRIERPLNQESTAMGAAYLAGMKSGIYKDVAEVEKLWKTDRKFEPAISLDEADQQYNRWLKTVKGLMNNG